MKGKAVKLYKLTPKGRAYAKASKKFGETLEKELEAIAKEEGK